MPRRAALSVTLVVVVVAALVAAPQPARADRDRAAEAWLVDAIDVERVNRGLHRLHLAEDVADVAYAWSARMAADGRLAHNPSHPDQICCWTVVTENVATLSGVGVRGGLDGALRDVHRLLMESSVHRANILHPKVNEIGVGVHVAGDTVWVTQNLRYRPDGPAPSSSSAESPAEPEPPAEPPARPKSPAATGSSGDRTPRSGGASSGEGATPEPPVDVHEVQARLSELGWYEGEVDGIMGPMTTEAVAGFQLASGLDVDGAIGADTLDALAADDAPHRTGAGAWADMESALVAVRQHVLGVWSLQGYRSPTVGEDHPVLVVLDRLVTSQAG